MTVEKQDTKLQALNQAVNYLAVGLGELEAIIADEQAAGEPRSLAMEDAAGAIALGIQELRRVMSADGAGRY